MNEKIKAHYDQLRAKRQRAARAMRVRSKLVKHVPQHMKEAKPERAKRKPAETIPFVDLPNRAFLPEGHAHLVNKVRRFYGLNNKYNGDGTRR
jgi:hypothetical protein